MALARQVRAQGREGLRDPGPITRRADDITADPSTGGDSGQRVMCGVKVAHVFDLAQTDGEPLPEPPRPKWLAGEDTAGLWDSLASLVAAAGYELQRNPEDGETQGWTRYAERVVSVRPDIDGAHAAAVLAHELGHVRADHQHRDISRAQKETEAESIAYVVTTACGLDSAASAVPYVAGWSRGDVEVIAAAAETVHKAASGILADLGCLGAADATGDRAAARTPDSIRHAEAGRLGFSATQPAGSRRMVAPRLDAGRSPSR